MKRGQKCLLMDEDAAAAEDIGMIWAQEILISSPVVIHSLKNQFQWQFDPELILDDSRSPS